MKNINNISINDFKAIAARLNALEGKVLKVQNRIFNKEIIDNADFIQLFQISGKTAQNWRKKGIIPFVQVESKIYYKVSDIKNMIDSNYNEK